MIGDRSHESQIDQDDYSAETDTDPACIDELTHVANDVREGVEHVGRDENQELVDSFLLVQDRLFKGSCHCRVARDEQSHHHRELDLQESPVWVDHEYEDKDVAAGEKDRAVLDRTK